MRTKILVKESIWWCSIVSGSLILIIAGLVTRNKYLTGIGLVAGGAIYFFGIILPSARASWKAEKAAIDKKHNQRIQEIEERHARGKQALEAYVKHRKDLYACLHDHRTKCSEPLASCPHREQIAKNFGDLHGAAVFFLDDFDFMRRHNDEMGKILSEFFNALKQTQTAAQK